MLDPIIYPQQAEKWSRSGSNCCSIMQSKSEI